ncbi:signal transduction histidine kinase [Streptomyces sp. CZ24]|uniref:ATP-binding protein n=2 Tax=Streptomyces TaxID=1883 RepID=UPI0006473B63|nr:MULTISPECIES: ATP-binding protein [unclassified Streptomyces]QDD58114.1 sensor histidine kinase [Streptomyces albidoflavus]MCG5120223.1 sensor histidine kinase [Streptomyces sp. T7(2022)]MCQ9710303.1 sensor histidine kinase [Streptomyces sp. BSP1]MDH6187886.1 signal transduction histidine kinase [Streptomyces sp. CZ24]UYX93060.1 sensor histidine kinase [Streptomyces sp. BI87]
MARSPLHAPGPGSGRAARTARLLWPLALALALATFLTAAALIARYGPVAAALGTGVAGVAAVALLERLRRDHRAALDEARRQGELVAARDEEAVRREARWRAYAEEQAGHVRDELAHLLKERLPAATSGTAGIPPAGPAAAELAETMPEVPGLLDRLLAEVAQEAADQAESQRLSLVELASRVQTSAHRIQATVTGLAERFPGDTDLLEATMQVDHAATQQARHAQSLKVLCGEWPGQQWQKPLALVDVVRAASGRIVAYRRVTVSGEPDLGVHASVVEPLIHLVAELLANATEYSPPRTSVLVTVRAVQRGAVIEVDDGGLGLDEYRLGHAREIVSGRRLLGVGEVGEIPQTGFAVVGRFADRHGFQVDLGPSPYGGVRAVVLIPLELLETLEPAGSRAAAPPAAEAPPAVPATAPAPEPPAPRERPRRAPGSRLPQRRSRRGEGPGPAGETPAGPAAPAPGTPEEAGDWMDAFFAGGRGEPDPPPAGPTDPHPHDSADPPEGQP